MYDARSQQITSSLFFLVAPFFSHLAYGDAFVVTRAMSASTIAEVFVDKDSVRIELEIGADDIHAFQDILPDDVYDRFGFAGALSHDERLKRFFEGIFVIQADGEKLIGKVAKLAARKRIARDEITGKPLKIQPDDAPIVIYAELEYPFSDEKTSISLRPPMIDGRVTANIGFMTYHRELPVMDFRYLSREETLDLDWQDPWYSKF